MSLVLLLCYSPCFDDISPTSSFARLFKTGVGPISVFFIVALHIGVGLSAIGAKIVVKDEDKGADAHCSGETSEMREKTDLENFNKNSYSTEKSAITKAECCMEKE